MKALVFREGCLGLEKVSRPVPKQGEALIRVLKAGICRTDLEITRGYMDFQGILGHEFVGRVESAEDRTLKGRRVVGEINIPCRSCALCYQGLENHCRERQVLGISGRDGVFAEFATLPERNLHPLPPEVSDTQAVFVEPLAAAFRVAEQVDLEKADTVLVVGDGKLGLLVAQALDARGVRVFCLGRHRRKLALLEKRGIPVSREGREWAHRFDVVVEATGNPTGLAEALQRVRPEGTVVVKSTFATEAAFDVSRLVVDEVVLVGSRCGPFPEAIHALATGEVCVEEMVDGEFPLERAEEAFALARKPGACKVLLSP
ncbi:MAG: alcohol dehydrogenase catalytic domain-containing protein [Candidatus Aminicenantales bacterium]